MSLTGTDRTEDVRKQLMALRNEIRNAPENWTYPEDATRGVGGFLGTAKVWFVGKQPSTGQSPGSCPSLSSFYQVLKENGLSEAHLTDLVKEVSKSKFKLSESKIKSHRHWMKSEIDLLQPILVVALGGETYDHLRLWKYGFEGAAIIEIHHYAIRYAKTEELERNREKLTEEVKQVATIAKKLGLISS